MEIALCGDSFLRFHINFTITGFEIFFWIIDDGSIMLNLGDHFRLLKYFGSNYRLFY